MGTGLGTCPDCKPADDATRGVPPVEVVAEAKSWQSDPVSGVADGNDGQRVGERGHEHVELKRRAGDLGRFPSAGASEASGHLALDHDLLRGISLKSSLHDFGRLWRKSPLELPDDTARAALWKRSAKVERLDIFLSHTWHTPGSQKVRALLVQSGCYCFVLAWFLCAALCIVLEVFAGRGLYQRDLSARLGGFFGSILGLLASPYLPQLCGSKMCFLDVVCIHQADPDLMKRGIYGLGGFLTASSELRILWSPPYLSRLWCVFELAAFRKANPSGRIVLKPLYLEVGLLYVILVNYMGVLIEEGRVRFAGDRAWDDWWILARAGATLPYVLLIHGLRRLCHEKHLLMEDLRCFELAKVSCRLPSDRDFIYTGIREWYGSEEAFERYVQGPLCDELIRPFRRSDLPAVYWLMAMTPIFANQVDLWLSILRNTSAVSPSLDLYRRLLALVVADAVTLMNLMVLTFLLCYCFARPAAGMCDCGKTLLVWFVLLLGFSASVVQTNIMSTWEVTVGISAAQVVAGVFLRWVVQRCG
ncbi:unnamed protein product [Symbiodinium natans]|uniref:Uncharacterized protein n=1 Tax=Symbiodinium natans TaxID=878477 RepID=A0A812NA21_9DINO|nr:unnamed protein product [Symbiodinium natans]